VHSVYLFACAAGVNTPVQPQANKFLGNRRKIKKLVLADGGRCLYSHVACRFAAKSAEWTLQEAKTVPIYTMTRNQVTQWAALMGLALWLWAKAKLASRA